MKSWLNFFKTQDDKQKKNEGTVNKDLNHNTISRKQTSAVQNK